MLGLPRHGERRLAIIGDDATVACSYFLHLCEALGVPLDPDALVVSPTPVTTRVGMQSLLERFVVPQLSATAGLHLTFFASDYQLSRLERIGAVTTASSQKHMKWNHNSVTEVVKLVG